MTILSKNNSPDKWKNKYFDLLNDNEILENKYQDNESLLCKTIIRITLATTGFNQELDPHLLKIRKQLKHGLKSSELVAELENFSKTLVSMDETALSEDNIDTKMLFDFLFFHFPEQKKDFQLIELQHENKEYPNSQYLFIAINDALESIQKIEPILQLADNNSETNEKNITGQLHQLLDIIEIPELFLDQVQILKEKLYNNISFSAVLDEMVSLFINIQKHVHAEHIEMTEFLTQLTNKLTDLGLEASQTNTASISNHQQRNLLDNTVSSQMFELQQSSTQATQLEPLKKLIHSRLSDISQQLQTHRAQDEIERIQTQQELKSLTVKISRLEQESSQLKNKLTTVHQKAIHDPLTGLPNRLAYDDRLEIEIARWQRYKTPLSILVWDIDYFKQINDTFGHKAGDKTLILISKLLSSHCRETDFVSRFGGEEFTMLLSNTDIHSALQTANKLRQVIEGSAFNSNGKKISITISCGMTEFKNDDTGETAFIRADAALFSAKNNGRNQCMAD